MVLLFFDVMFQDMTCVEICNQSFERCLFSCFSSRQEIQLLDVDLLPQQCSVWKSNRCVVVGDLINNDITDHK